MDNAIFPNKFKAALATHQVQIGCWCALANPISTEVLGLAGFDWLVLDAEHAPNDVTTLIPQLMALKGSSSAQVVRVPTNEPIIIKRMLDIGFYNFLVPFVETAEQAAQAVASTRYPPEGIRGVSVSHRGNMFGTVPDYFAQSNKNISILVQIESQTGVDNVEAIAATEGVDGVFVGPKLHDERALFGWQHFSLPLRSEPQAPVPTQAISPGILTGPGIYTGTIEVETPADSFLSLPGFNLGCVFLNGFNLGRYWSVGPQQTLAVHAPHLKTGTNTLTIVEFGQPSAPPAAVFEATHRLSPPGA